MSLEDFETRLAQVMRDADIRTVLVVNNRARDMTVQVYVDEVANRGMMLVGSIVGSHLKPGSEKNITDSGFARDTTLPGRVWYKRSEWPVRSTDLRDVGECRVNGVRGVH